MKVYTYSEARQKLSDVLDRAKVEGEVRIKRRDGGEFVVRPAQRRGPPLDVEGVDTDVTAEEIVDAVRELRERS
jgi:prevent-host-death family protein